MQDTALPSAVLDAMHQLTLAYRRHMRAAVHTQALELTPNGLKVLLFVGQHPLCTHKDVMAHTGADKAQIARLLQQMEDGQWLERLDHPQDKRSRCLRLSPQGDTAFRALGAQRQSLGRHMLQSCDLEQQQQLLQTLRHMHAQLAALPLPELEPEVASKISAAHLPHIHD